MNRLAVLLLSLALAPWALAADPPGRVGRLGFAEGEVSVFTDPQQGWEPAALNAHLTGENSVWTEPRSRAEVRIGSTALRLGEATQLDIARLDDELLRAHVVRGSLSVRIRYFEKGDTYEVTTPEARFQLRGNGRYRIDADPDRGESRLTVFSGTARLEAAGGYVQVDTGRAVRVSGGARSAYEFEHARTTSLDEWAQGRDERFAQREASRYVSPRMTGWEDLDNYGEWRNEPEYGSVWFPANVEADWAPYRHGRWTWVRPWGWSWVDDAPWGYAPFHYGRWVYAGSRWGWYPGRYTPRPVWAPALVGWVGRPGWSLSISASPSSLVGWYPLSPFDNYQPWYAANANYVNHINRVVIVNRQPAYRHYNREFGATVVARDVFASQRPVHRNLAPVPRDVVAAQPIHSGPSMLPPRSEWRPRPQQGVGSQPAPQSAPSATGLPPPSTAPLVAPSGRPAPLQAPSSAPLQSRPPVMVPAPSAAPSQPRPPVMVPAPSAAPSQPRPPVMVPAPSAAPSQPRPPVMVPAPSAAPSAAPVQPFVPAAPSSAPAQPRTSVLVPAPSAAPSGQPRNAAPVPAPSAAPSVQPPAPAPAAAPSRTTRPAYESALRAQPGGDASAPGASPRPRPAPESREQREARPAQQFAAPPQSAPRPQPQPQQAAPRSQPQQPQQVAPQGKPVEKQVEKPGAKPERPPKTEQHSGG